MASRRALACLNSARSRNDRRADGAWFSSFTGLHESGDFGEGLAGTVLRRVETAAMPGHDDFETAIEQRRHGALDPEGAARLDEHLASCLACGAFATLTTQTEDEMRQQAAAAIEGIDWSWIEKGVVEWRAKTRRSFWIGVISTLAVLPSLLYTASVFGYVASVGLAIGVAVSYRHDRRALVESHDAERSHGSLLQFYRGRVAREIVLRRRGLAFLFAFAIAIVAVAFTMRLSSSTRIFAIGLATMFVAGGAWSAFVTIPRLRRERAALD
jgi:hypothetical protein